MQAPLAGFTSLGLDEADVFDLARWPEPEPCPAGLALGKARVAATEPRYRENFTRLTDTLGGCLAGFDAVFTHNPWGEYGHEEHVQVYRAVRHVQESLGFDLWCSAYVGSRSHSLMARCLDGTRVESITLDTDAAFARAVAAHYKEHGVWTWFDAYVWPERESFLRLTPGAGGRAGMQSAPLNYLDMGAPMVSLADRSLRSLARRAGERLSLANRNETPFV